MKRPSRLTRAEFGRMFYSTWFSRSVSEITIVAPPSYDNLPDAELSSANYALLDRCGDRDSVFAVGKLLSRMYPRAYLNLLTSDDLKHQSLLRNLVVIGGPGGLEIDADSRARPVEGNGVCRILAEKIGTKVGYGSNCDVMRVGGH